MCLIASVQTSLTMPVHLCKILYVSLCLGFKQRKDVFFVFFPPLCNIKTSVYFTITVYFLKVLQNYGNFCNWDLESFTRLQRVVSKFTVYKKKL